MSRSATPDPCLTFDHLLTSQLTALGIQPQSISFQTLTLESDHFICVYV